MSDEHEMEPIPGLPEELPDGEYILWQGSPDWRGLAMRAYHLKLAALYFGLFALWSVVSGLADGLSAAAVAMNLVALCVPALVGGGVLLLLAWLTARTTIYTLTNRRIVMRFGMALPMVVNVPFSIVTAAGAKLHADGTADIPLTLSDGNRLGYFVLWPNARPWRLRRPEPMLRVVPDGQAAAQRIANALAAYADRPAAHVQGAPSGETQGQDHAPAPAGLAGAAR